MTFNYNLRNVNKVEKVKNQLPPVWKFCARCSLARCSFGEMLLARCPFGEMFLAGCPYGEMLWPDALAKCTFPNRGTGTSIWGEVSEKKWVATLT